MRGRSALSPRRAAQVTAMGALLLVGSLLAPAGSALAGSATITAVGTLVTANSDPLTASQATIEVSPGAVGDVLAMAIETKFPSGPSLTASGVSGGGVSTWTKAASHTTTDGTHDEELWWGVVTTTGTNLQITVSFSQTPTSPSAASLDVQEFRPSSGAATSWSLDVEGVEYASTGAGTTGPYFPALTPTSPSTNEAYFGYLAVPGSVTTVNGTPTGVVYQVDLRGNETAYDESVSSNVAPVTSSATSQTFFSIGMLLSADVAAKTNQTISFTSTAPTSATVGGATYTATATATSGLAVTLTIDSSASSVCSINGSGVVSFIGAGTCVIDANQAGNSTYNPAPQVQQSFSVAAKTSGGGGPAPATPQIDLAVSASPTSLVGSGSVTYTYTVTNPGSVALSGVSISDITCSPATYVSGDTNKDGLLEPGESWTFTCITTLAATTTDHATATGTGNGTAVSATAATSVTVTTPSALTPVTLIDGIAAGVNRGTSGFGTRSVVVARNSYITLFVQTNPNLAGSLVQIWVKSKATGWHPLTLRMVAADGTVHYFARVNGWTAYWVKYSGDTTRASASSHGRIATNPA